MSFDARQNVVGKLLNDSIYRIPRNQRSFVWDRQRWDDLFSDVKLVVELGITSHFIGSLVFKRENQEAGLDVYSVIDGQQRIITITILLSSIMFEFKRRQMVDDAEGLKKHLIASDNRGGGVVIVDTERHLTLERIVEKVIQALPQEMKKASASAFAKEACLSTQNDKNIVEAFMHFCSLLKSFSNDCLIQYKNAVVNINYVGIYATTEEDSYTIFEILNARGSDLSTSALLKNYILRYIHPDANRDDAKRLWLQIEDKVEENIDEFLRHYAIHKFGSEKANRNKSADNGVYRVFCDSVNPKDTRSLLYDIAKKADYYARIVSPSTDDRESEVLLFFKSKRVRIFRPLLMSLMHAKEREDLDSDGYISILDYLYRFYAAYKLCGDGETNMLTGLIRKYAFNIETNYSDSLVRELKDSLRDKLPSEEGFVKIIQTIGWSHKWGAYKGDRAKKRCRLALELLEESKSGIHGIFDYSIEHIQPDSADESNALIGNLLPLENALNRRCGDKSPHEKIAIYKESSFMTTRRVAERLSEGVFDVSKRTEFIARDLYKWLIN